ncbi:metallophosphoesterase family protein [Sulfurospirillum arsenophilum]|uniref:metallophosphoesterase family protein n=1 Tax=Sulfurospirillum arsenophilum TaxID=56698 RepID=UPI0005AB59B3|nr:exonuclease SbcCD subunit D [Sulfurospirillum arsenophilum]
MRLIHFSDTHLGFNDLDTINDAGINQREADFYDTFTQVIDAILLEKPDYVIHTGDLFHRPHPSNRAISFALSALKRLSIAKIPTIIIAGNHSTPRTRTASPILLALRTLDHIYSVFEEAYEKIEFDDIVFHCIPHINDETDNLQAIELCENSVVTGKRNVMMLHCSVGQKYIMEEYGERVYPHDKESLFAQMDYVALGHWHGFGKVGKHPNVYYAGSTERTSSADVRIDKGYVRIGLDEDLYVNLQTITLRPNYRLTIDATKDIILQLEEYAQKEDMQGALLYITLENLTITQSIDIANHDIEAIFPTALSVQIQRKFAQSESSISSESVSAASLQEHFSAFLKEQSNDEDEFKRLNSKVTELFAQYDEVNDDA